MNPVHKFIEEVYDPLSDHVTKLNDNTMEYALKRVAYERNRNAETNAAYQTALFNLKEAHREWKALFSQLTQAKRL